MDKVADMECAIHKRARLSGENTGKGAGRVVLCSFPKHGGIRYQDWRSDALGKILAASGSHEA